MMPFLNQGDRWWVQILKSGQTDGMPKFFNISSNQSVTEGDISVVPGVMWWDLLLSGSGTVVDTYGERYNEDDWLFENGWALSDIARIPGSVFDHHQWTVKEDVWEDRTKNPAGSTRFHIDTLDPCPPGVRIPTICPVICLVVFGSRLRELVIARWLSPPPRPCGVHYLWFAFVCFLIRSHPPGPVLHFSHAGHC